MSKIRNNPLVLIIPNLNFRFISSFVLRILDFCCIKLTLNYVTVTVTRRTSPLNSLPGELFTFLCKGYLLSTYNKYFIGNPEIRISGYPNRGPPDCRISFFQFYGMNILLKTSWVLTIVV